MRNDLVERAKELLNRWTLFEPDFPDTLMPSVRKWFNDRDAWLADAAATCKPGPMSEAEYRKERERLIALCLSHGCKLEPHLFNTKSDMWSVLSNEHKQCDVFHAAIKSLDARFRSQEKQHTCYNPTSATANCQCEPSKGSSESEDEAVERIWNAYEKEAIESILDALREAFRAGLAAREPKAMKVKVRDASPIGKSFWWVCDGFGITQLQACGSRDDAIADARRCAAAMGMSVEIEGEKDADTT